MPRISSKPKIDVSDVVAADTSPAPATPSKAKNRPVTVRKMTESQEQQVGQDGVREFNEKNELPQIQVVPPEGKSKKWLEDMAFANEIVTVMIHESTDKSANPFPEVIVNGRVQRFVRGHEQQVRRCYVEKLARMKLTTYSNLKTKDVDGEDVYRYPSSTGLQFPFVVIDDSPKGVAWLKGILAEGG